MAIRVSKPDAFVGGSLKGLAQNIEITPVFSQTSTAALGSLLVSIIGACSRPPVLVVSTKQAPLKASFAIDTGVAVNVLLEDTYSAFKRKSRGDRYPLHLKGVGAEKLDILALFGYPLAWVKLHRLYV